MVDSHRIDTPVSKVFVAGFYIIFVLLSALWPVSVPVWLLLNRGERFDVALVALVPGVISYSALGYYYWLLSVAQ